MNYNQYPAKGVDEKVLILQNILNLYLGWPDVNFFGRITKVASTSKKKQAVFYNSEREGTDVYLDDKRAKAGSVFFIDADEHTGKDARMMEAKIKLVFMLDLSQIVAGANYRADSEVHDHVLRLVRSSRTMHDIGILKKFESIFTDIDTDAIAKLDVQPKHVFAITGTIKYYQ